MDDYPYATLADDGWLCCDGLHHPDFSTLFWDELHHFGHTETPVYHGRPYHEFGCGHCEVHMDVPAHPFDPGMTACFTTATGDDLNDTLERAAHQTLMESCEFHLPGLVVTVVALFPIQNEGNAAWSERLAAVGDPKRLTYHMGWALTTCYAQHVSSMLQEVTVTGAYQHLRLEEYDHQVAAKNCLIEDI
jgi:hypothetical protein